MKNFTFSQFNNSTTCICFLIAIASASNELQRGMFNGKEITALAYQFPPFFNYKKMKDGNYTFEGISKNDMDEYEEYLNMSIKYVIIDPVKVTHYGFWKALFETLDNKEVDIIPFLLEQDLDSLKHMEIAAAIWIDPLKLLQPWPDEQSRLTVTTRPFQLTVWLAFFITTTVFVFITAAFIRNRYKIDDDVSAHHESILETVFNQAEYVSRIMTNQGNSGSHTRDRSSYKVLTGIWLLSMVVLINGYSGVLTSLLTIPKLNPIAKTMKDVAESRELRVTCEKNLPISKLFLDATEGYEKVLGDQLRRDPGLLVSDAFAALENVVHHKGAYPGAHSLVNFMIRSDLKTSGYCRMTGSPDLRDYQSLAFQWGFPKGSPYVRAVTEITLLFWANGIIPYNQRKLFSSAIQCETDVPPTTRIRSLTLLDLSPAFFILGLGLPLSVLSFLLEIIAKKFVF